MYFLKIYLEIVFWNENIYIWNDLLSGVINYNIPNLKGILAIIFLPSSCFIAKKQPFELKWTARLHLCPFLLLLEADLETCFQRQTKEKNKAQILFISTLQWNLVSKRIQEVSERKDLSLLPSLLAWGLFTRSSRLQDGCHELLS